MCISQSATPKRRVMDTKSVNKVDTVASSVWEPSFLYFCLLFEALALKEMARVTVKLTMARFLVACTLPLLTQLVELTLRGQTKQRHTAAVRTLLFPAW